MKWGKKANGEPLPIFTNEEAQRVALLAWEIQFALPHPDDVATPEEATLIREFNRAVQGLPAKHCPETAIHETKKEMSK